MGSGRDQPITIAGSSDPLQLYRYSTTFVAQRTLQKAQVITLYIYIHIYIHILFKKVNTNCTRCIAKKTRSLLFTLYCLAVLRKKRQVSTCTGYCSNMAVFLAEFTRKEDISDSKISSTCILFLSVLRIKFQFSFFLRCLNNLCPLMVLHTFIKNTMREKDR